MPRIFVSYSRQDLAAVQRLEQALKANGLSVWRDQESLYGGQQWPKAIGEAIATSDYFLLLWSKKAADSHFVEFEWTTAVALRKPLIPCLLDDTPLPSALLAVQGLDVNAPDASARLSAAFQAATLLPPPTEHVSQVLGRLEGIGTVAPDQVASKARAMYAQQGWSVQGNVYQANGNLYVTVQQPADSKQGRSKLETWSKRVALVAAVIGIIISLFTLRDKIKETFFVNGSHPTIEIAAKNLADSSPELRTLGSQQLAEVGMKTLKDAEHSISILNTFLHREAAKAQRAQQTQQRADVLDVLRALNGILKNADNKRWVVRKPVLEKLNLSNLDLSNIYLRGVRISETSFEGANLSNADFSGATLVVVRFDRAQAQGAKFIGVTIENSCMEGIDLTKADLSSAAVNNSDINSAILVEATLHEAKLLNTRVADADFRDSDLSSADLSDAREIKRGQLDRAKNVDSAQLPDPLYKQSRLRVCNPLE